MVSNNYIDYDVYSFIKSVEKKANDLGFKFKPYRFSDSTNAKLISLEPIDDMSYPIYSRDAQIFTGTMDQINSYLHGIEFMKQYLERLNIVSDKKISDAEQKVRNRQLMQILKDA